MTYFRLPLLVRAFVWAGFLISAPAFADTLDAKIAASFAPFKERYAVPGLVVSVTENGVHHFYTTGLASRADHRPVTPDTIFELGSMSKIFNVTLAALAVERGKMNLSDTVAHHLCDDRCTIGNDLTLLDLATHHSGGLPLQVPGRVTDIKDLTRWLEAWHPPQPGARSYSNISIGLLGYISAQSLGMTYTKAVQTVLFPAFGLSHSWIDVPASEMKNYAYGYDKKTDAPERVHPGLLAAEAYGVKSTPSDMLNVLDIEMGLGHPPEELKRAVKMTQQGRYKTAFFTQDMIWEHYPWPTALQPMLLGNGYDFIMKPHPVTVIASAPAHEQEVIFNKTGSTDGFGGYIAMIPSKHIGVVVLANKNTPNEARVEATYKLLDALLAK
ncbi:class C beta-lactamase [Asaia sp. BMEF1]|uniref:class C beta-lactamase n=1 Tax=Asaia sp. BMEF1 TaxID=3155932 RepID=UPI003F67C24A